MTLALAQCRSFKWDCRLRCEVRDEGCSAPGFGCVFPPHANSSKGKRRAQSFFCKSELVGAPPPLADKGAQQNPVMAHTTERLRGSRARCSVLEEMSLSYRLRRPSDATERQPWLASVGVCPPAAAGMKKP